jgi:hypothetical protein
LGDEAVSVLGVGFGGEEEEESKEKGGGEEGFGEGDHGR